MCTCLDVYGQLPYYEAMAAKDHTPTGPKHRAVRATRQSKASRIEARLSEEAKALFQQAADLRGETLTDFVLAASREKAVETIRESQLVRLATDDQRRFAQALLDPPPPSPRLRNAARRHRQTVK